MKKVLALTLALLLLWGCSAQPAQTTPSTTPSDQDSVLSTDTEIAVGTTALAVETDAGFDPYTCTSSCNRFLMELVLQPLFTVSATGEVSPVLASGWSVSTDGLTTTVGLKNGVTFHDGTPLTAQAVVESVERARAGSYYAGRFHYLDSVAAAGDFTVVFTTTKAYECFPLLLDVPIVSGEGVFPVGTGPYVWSSTVYLRPFDGWQGTYPAGQQAISLKRITTASQLRDGFQYGGVSAAAFDPNAAGAANYNGDYALWSVPTTIMQYVGFHLRHGPFSSGALRSAVTYAIDRETIVTEDMAGFGVAAPLAALPGSAWDSTELSARCEFAPEKLTQYVPAGTTATMIVCGDNPQRTASAKRIARQLTDCGLAVTVEALSAKDFEAALSAGKFDLYYAEARLSPNLDLSPFFRSGGSLAYGGLGGYGGVDALCDLTRSNSGNAYDLQKAILTDGLLCPVAFKSTAVYVHRNTLTGIAPKLNGWNF